MANPVPIFTDSVNQNFFIEALRGTRDPISYLDRFPDAVYTKAIDSVLVTFLYALLGPAGAGYLRQQYLDARLQIEAAGLSTANLDALYTSPLAFVRLAEETYDIDTNATLLSAQDAAHILISDAKFRNRAIDFLKGIRAGGTLLGLSLVAKSGLNHSVDLVENYRALYDQYCDLPLGLSYIGSTQSLNEVIVLPRREVPQDAQHTFVLDGEPTSGWFTIVVPLGPPWQTILVEASSIVDPVTGDSSNVVTVPDASQIPPGVFVSITNNTTTTIGTSAPTIYATAGTTLDTTDIALVHPSYSVSAGQPYSHGLTNGLLYWAYVGNAETIPLPYNATANMIQDALGVLPVVGAQNVLVNGGPLPDQPITITFRNQLGNQVIPAIFISMVPTSPIINGVGTGGAPRLTDQTGSFLNVTATVTIDTIGTSGDSNFTAIPPSDIHAMQVALDQIKPMTTLITTQPAQPTTIRQPSILSNTFGDSIYVETLRYETGNHAVKWPRRDKTHWIESGVEHEAPKPVGTTKQHYQGFHNIAKIYAYTEAALNDSHYASDVTKLSTYWDTKVGRFLHTQVLLFPFLKQFTNPHHHFRPTDAIASSPDPLVITGRVGGKPIINGIYPADYRGLHGVPTLPPNKNFWASIERTPPTHVDYLEIDLGTAQAVNYIYFEGTNKPFTISLDYDTLDQEPSRNFVPVTWMDAALAKSTIQLSYHQALTRAWSTVELHFTNNLNQMIFTRYLRIGFHRKSQDSPFVPRHKPPIPYSIEVRGLRVGRNIAAPLNRRIRA